MIVVTGGAGFIGSALIHRLNSDGESNILVIDNLGIDDKWKNLVNRNITDILSIEDGKDCVTRYQREITAVFHMGACSSTTEADGDFLLRRNLHDSQFWFQFCAAHKIPFIYASSAATYGSEEVDFGDDPQILQKLRPINKYGYSKSLFDQWNLKQTQRPPVCVGLKFFNVYGPNEYHKGSQASVAYHAFGQAQQKGIIKLFKSYRPGIADGDQRRDFVYVKDVVEVAVHFLNNPNPEYSGIFNVGTGTAKSFNQLVAAIFSALGIQYGKIDYIEMPEAIKGQYQYFTEANLERLRFVAKYSKNFVQLEDGVKDYYQNYLLSHDPYL